MRSTTTVTVWACLAEVTRPTRVRRCDRRHECAGASADEPCAALGARRKGRARFTATGAAGRAAAGFGAAAPVVFLGAAAFAVVFFSAVALVGVVFFSAAGAFSALAAAGFATVFFSVVVAFFAVVFFSAIRRLSLSFVHHGQYARDALPHGRQAAIVLELASGQLEPEVEELLLRVLELAIELGIRQPPHVLQLHCSRPPPSHEPRTSS